MRHYLEPGNIRRTQWQLRMADNINLYLGSGRAGASFDAYGLMGNGFRGEKTSVGVTSFMHADHWHRGAHGIDSRLHAFRIVFADALPPAPEAYEQSLDLYDGRLVTALSFSGLRYTITAFCDPAMPDMLALDIRYDSTTMAMPSLLLAPETELPVSYGDVLEGSAVLQSSSMDTALLKLSIGTAESIVGLRVISTRGKAVLSEREDGIGISFSGARGRHLILAGLASWKRRVDLVRALASIVDGEQYAADAAHAWHVRYGDAGLSVPVPKYQAMWARSLYYTLASYGPDMRAPAQPCGWSGNMWRYSFPQDLSYIHPALLRLGHYDIARSWVEFYHSFIDDMRSFTKRIFKADGTMWAWEFPIAKSSQLLDAARPGEPNWYQYEIHNAAYVARMAYETALHCNDRKWARAVAWPIVKATADFYASVLTREKNGRYGIRISPSMGQDEMGGHNKKNYLCALFSAEYAIGKALLLAKRLSIECEDAQQWRAVMRAGLTYDALYDPKEGVCGIYESSIEETFGKQKHPVQLNPLNFLPLGKPSPFTVKAYERRYDICRDVKENRFYGWTLAAFWVASSHMGSADGLLGDLSQAGKSRYVDPDWLQIYETSLGTDIDDDPRGLIEAPTCYYVTSHGLYLQAMNDALVSDYFGKTVIGGACPRSWDGVSFSNFRTQNGEIISGEMAGGKWKLSRKKMR